MSIDELTVTPLEGDYTYNMPVAGRTSETLSIPFYTSPSYGKFTMEVIDDNQTLVSFKDNVLKIKVAGPQAGEIRTVKYRMTLSYLGQTKTFDYTDVIQFSSNVPIDSYTITPASGTLDYNISLPSTSVDIPYTVTPSGGTLSLEVTNSNGCEFGLNNNVLTIDYPPADITTNKTVSYNMVLEVGGDTIKFPYTANLSYIASRNLVTVYPAGGTAEQVIELPATSITTDPYEAVPGGTLTIEELDYNGATVTLNNDGTITMSYPTAVKSDRIKVSYKLTAKYGGSSGTEKYIQYLNFVDNIVPIDTIVVDPGRGTYNYTLVNPTDNLTIPYTATPYGTFELQVVSNPNSTVTLVDGYNVEIVSNNPQVGVTDVVEYNMILHANGDISSLNYIINIDYKDLTISPPAGDYDYKVDLSNFSASATDYTLYLPYTIDPTGTIALSVTNADGTIISMNEQLGTVIIAANAATTPVGTVKNISYDLNATSGGVTHTYTYNLTVSYVNSSYQLNVDPSAFIQDNATISIGSGMTAISASIINNPCVDGLSASVVNGNVVLSVAPGSIPTTTACFVDFSISGREGSKSILTDNATISITTQPYLNFTPTISTFELETTYGLGFNNVTGVTFTSASVTNCSGLTATVSGTNDISLDGTAMTGDCANAQLEVTGSKTDYTTTTSTFNLNVTRVFTPVISAVWDDNTAVKGSFVRILNASSQMPYFTSPVTLNIVNDSLYPITLVDWTGSTEGITVTIVDNTTLSVAVDPAATYSANYMDITLNVSSPNRTAEFTFKYYLDNEDGSAARPYKIYDLTKLNLVKANTLNLDKHYLLMNNIALPATAWTPIGNTTNAFAGTFDGQGYTISSMTLPNGNNIGFFGVVDQATIKNLNVIYAGGLTSGSNSGVGVFAGKVSHSTVDNCSATGLTGQSISGVDSIGGFIGYIDNTTITNCFASVNMNPSNNSGGFVGWMNSGSIKYSYVKNATINMTTTNDYFIGGFVGYMVAGTIDQCFSANAATTGGQPTVVITGGMVGYLVGGSITNTYVTSYLPGSTLTSSGRVGGIVGLANGNTSIMFNYVTEDINCGGARCAGILSTFNAAATTNLKNNAALMANIIQNFTTQTFNRIAVFTAQPATQNNYALSTMYLEFNGVQKTFPSSLNGDSGADVLLANLPTLFSTASNWQAPWDPAIWDFAGNGTYNLPILKAIPASVQPAVKPSHL